MSEMVYYKQNVLQVHKLYLKFKKIIIEKLINLCSSIAVPEFFSLTGKRAPKTAKVIEFRGLFLGHCR